MKIVKKMLLNNKFVIKEELEDLYHKQNLTPEKIGRMYNPPVHLNTVKNWLNYFGIKKKTRSKVFNKCNWTKEELEDMYALDKQNLFASQISKMHNPPVTSVTIGNWLDDFNIKRKTPKCNWTKEELENMYALDKQNLSIIKISKICDSPISLNTIGSWLDHFGIKRKTQSESREGKNSSNWQGGISFEPYCQKFNNNVREQVRNYWHRKCVLCNVTEEKIGQKLDVHHVDYNKNQGCDSTKWKLLSLCRSCNTMVNGDRDYYENLFSNIIMIREILEEYDNNIDWRSIGI